MGSIPKKCENANVANSPLFRWWCMLVCSLTRGWICSPWCWLAEKWGMWTLWITLPLPVAVLYLLYVFLLRGK